MVVQSYQNHNHDGTRKVQVEMDDASNDDGPQSQDEAAIDMIIEDLKEAVTGLMRLTKPINDYYLLGTHSNVERGIGSTSDGRFSSALAERFPQIPGFLLERLTQSIGEKSGELSTAIKRTQAVRADHSGDDSFCDVYRSVNSVLEDKPDNHPGDRDLATSDQGSISSFESGNVLLYPAAAGFC